MAEDETSKMKFSIAEQVADASELTPLRRGDILLTGAGAVVSDRCLAVCQGSLGPLALGDHVEGLLEGLDGKYTVSTTLVAKPKKKASAL